VGLTQRHCGLKQQVNTIIVRGIGNEVGLTSAFRPFRLINQRIAAEVHSGAISVAVTGSGWPICDHIAFVRGVIRLCCESERSSSDLMGSPKKYGRQEGRAFINVQVGRN
jgi:hypothetical protein